MRRIFYSRVFSQFKKDRETGQNRFKVTEIHRFKVTAKYSRKKIDVRWRRKERRDKYIKNRKT